MRKLILFLICINSRLISDEWMESVQNRIDPSLKEWMKQEMSHIKPKSDIELNKLYGKSKCIQRGEFVEEQEGVQIFMSFSLPNAVWISLSKELEKTGGCFVIRGIPNNSFSKLSQKTRELSDLGVLAQIKIDPKSFESYEVDKVPTFVIKRDIGFDKISGNISLTYALEKMESR